MFCKWCGADLPNSATKCTRCGKDVPAMSDCGGFYDLVPNAKRPVEESPFSQPVPSKVDSVRVDPVKSDPPKKEDPTKGKKSSGRKRSDFPLIVILVGFATIIALLLSMNGKLSDGFAKLDDINGRINSIFSEEDNTTSPADEGVPNDAAIEEQNVKIEITVEHTDGGSSVKTTAYLGDFEDGVVDKISFNKENHSLAAVQIDLGSMKNCIEVEIENSLIKTGVREGTISVAFDVSESVFAKMAGDFELAWVYRINGETEWTTLDEDVFTVSNDGATVTYNARELAKLIGDAEMVEFSVTYERANDKDGSLTVIISGISVTKQTLEARTNTFN